MQNLESHIHMVDARSGMHSWNKYNNPALFMMAAKAYGIDSPINIRMLL